MRKTQRARGVHAFCICFHYPITAGLRQADDRHKTRPQGAIRHPKMALHPSPLRSRPLAPLFVPAFFLTLRRDDDQRRVVVKTAAAEARYRVYEASLQRGRAARPLREGHGDEPVVAELVSLIVADLGDSVGIEDQTIAAAQRNASLVVPAVGEHAKDSATRL